MPRFLNILITTPTFPPLNSGLGNAVREQVMMLSAMGHAVTVATYGPARTSSQQDGYVLETFDVSGASILSNPFRGDVQSYRQFLIDSRFDLVMLNAWQIWSTDVALTFLDRIAGKKLLCSHCLSTNLFFWRSPFRSTVRYLLWRPYHWRLASRLRALDGLVVLAPSGCDTRFDDLRLARKIGTPVFVIPNALAHSPTADDRVSERSYLLSVGAYEWAKGHDFVLRAYALSAAKNRIPLKIYGQHFNAFTDQLRQSLAGLGIDERFVSFHEGVSGEELLEQYRGARVFLYGSHTECQPLVLLDAMASGTPFVSRASGCIDTMAGGVAVADERQAARELDRLLVDGTWWQHQQAAAREGVRAHSHASVSVQWGAALERVLATPPSANYR